MSKQCINDRPLNPTASSSKKKRIGVSEAMDGWMDGWRMDGRVASASASASASVPSSSFAPAHRRRRRARRTARPNSTSTRQPLIPSSVDRYASRYDPCEHEWVRPRMRAGTGTFEPIRRATGSDHDPCAEREVDVDVVFVTPRPPRVVVVVVVVVVVTPNRYIEEPIRSDPIRSNRPRARGWEPMDARRRDDSLGDEPIDRGVSRASSSSPFRPSPIVLTRAVAEKNKRRVVAAQRTRPGWRRAWRGTSSFNRSCVDMSSARATDPRIGMETFPESVGTNVPPGGGAQSLNPDSSWFSFFIADNFITARSVTRRLGGGRCTDGMDG